MASRALRLIGLATDTEEEFATHHYSLRSFSFVDYRVGSVAKLDIHHTAVQDESPEVAVDNRPTGFWSFTLPPEIFAVP